MKLHFLCFISIAFCAFQPDFPKKAYESFCFVNGPVSTESFEEIRDFVLRVETVKSDEPVTEKDKKMLSNLGFDGIVELLSFSRHSKDNNILEGGTLWEEIENFSNSQGQETCFFDLKS